MEERAPNCMKFGVQCGQGAIEKTIKDMTIMEGAVFPFVKSGMISQYLETGRSKAAIRKA